MYTPSPAYGQELKNPIERIASSLKDARPVPFWLDHPSRPVELPSLEGETTADLLVVGGGYSGLWTALLAKEDNPSLDVVLLEARSVGWAASGRNGGFVEATLTHGETNGRLHFPSEFQQLESLGLENFYGFRETIERYNMNVEYEESGVLTVATEPHQVAWFEQDDSSAKKFDKDSIKQLISSPVFLAGRLEHEGVALVNPAKLAWELRRVLLELGVRIFEASPVKRLKDFGEVVRAETPRASVRAKRVALATNAFPSLLKRNRLFTVPVYYYVLMTEPLSDEELRLIGWTDRFGITDSSRQFHYYRKTKDNRILFGGYDVIYHRGKKILDAYDQRRETFERLADHFCTTFPQLNVRFSHAWGGAIDMCTRLFAYQGVAWNGKVAYSAGFTGLGVASTRFGAQVMLDLLGGTDTDLTRLKAVRSKPIPVPPEPFAYPIIQLMRGAVQRSDANGGRDGILLKTAEAFGIGFDS